MPDMVFSLCKLARVNLDKKTMQQRITLDAANKESIAQFNTVYNFATESEFIKESEGKVTTELTDTDLMDFKHFSYAVFSRVFFKNNKFSQLAKWYLSQNIETNLTKKTSVLGISSESDFHRIMPNDMKLRVDERYFNGFRFWMTALGLTAFYSPGSSQQGVPILYATQKALRLWLEYAKPFPVGTRIEADTFFKKLRDKCPVFEECIDMEKTSISPSLSSGLRVLDQAGVIQLGKVDDAANLWRLTRSLSFGSSNTISYVLIKEQTNG